MVLFLVITVPLHVWPVVYSLHVLTIYSESYTVGLLSYSLVTALMESLLVFMALMLISFLVPRRWREETLVVQLGTLFYVAAFWLISIQVYRLMDLQEIRMIKRIYLHVTRLDAYGIFAILFSFAAPLVLVTKVDGVKSVVFRMMDKISILASLYLMFDGIALLIAIFRNV